VWHPPERARAVALTASKCKNVDEGDGDPIVLLHGEPKRSYLHRRVIPE